jgi:hypothetical protein
MAGERHGHGVLCVNRPLVLQVVFDLMTPSGSTEVDLPARTGFVRHNPIPF